mgnify:FL=1
MEHNQGYFPTVIMVQNLRLAARIVRAAMNNQIYYEVKFSLFISYLQVDLLNRYIRCTLLAAELESNDADVTALVSDILYIHCIQ